MTWSFRGPWTRAWLAVLMVGWVVALSSCRAAACCPTAALLPTPSPDGYLLVRLIGSPRTTRSSLLRDDCYYESHDLGSREASDPRIGYLDSWQSVLLDRLVAAGDKVPVSRWVTLPLRPAPPASATLRAEVPHSVSVRVSAEGKADADHRLARVTIGVSHDRAADGHETVPVVAPNEGDLLISLDAVFGTALGMFEWFLELRWIGPP